MGLLQRIFGGGRGRTYRPSYRPSGFSPMAVGTGVAMMGAPMYYGQQQANPNQYRPTAYHQQVAQRAGAAPQPFFRSTAAMTQYMQQNAQSLQPIDDPRAMFQTMNDYASHLPRAVTGSRTSGANIHGVFGSETSRDGDNLYQGEGPNNPRFTGFLRTPTWNLWNGAGNDHYGTGYTMARWGQGADRSKDRPLEALYSGYTRALRDSEGDLIKDTDGNLVYSRPVDLFQRGDGSWVMGYPKVDDNGQFIPGQYERIERGAKGDKWIPQLMVGDQSYTDYMAARQQAAQQGATPGANPVTGQGNDVADGASGEDIFATRPPADGAGNPNELGNQLTQQELEYARSSHSTFLQQMQAHPEGRDDGSLFGMAPSLNDHWNRNRQLWADAGLIGQVPAQGDLSAYVDAASRAQGHGDTGADAPYYYDGNVYRYGDLHDAVGARQAALQQQIEEHRRLGLEALDQRQSFATALGRTREGNPGYLEDPAYQVLEQQQQDANMQWSEHWNARRGEGGLDGQLQQVQNWGDEIGYAPPVDQAPPAGGEVLPGK